MADHSQGGDDSTSETMRGKGTNAATRTSSGSSGTRRSPCGACKFLRRKCGAGCIFAPYFGTDQGAAKFAAVHKVFGASNVSKILSHIPTSHRHEAAATISYEAQARLSDPVYGCVSTIAALQQQVAALQAELTMMQTQLMNSRFAYASALQSSTTTQQQPNFNVAAVLQPAYSNNNSSAASTTNLVNMSNPISFDLSMETTMPSSLNLDPLQHSGGGGGGVLSQYDQEDD